LSPSNPACWSGGSVLLPFFSEHYGFTDLDGTHQVMRARRGIRAGKETHLAPVMLRVRDSELEAETKSRAAVVKLRR
jgi:hypothetical protein